MEVALTSWTEGPRDTAQLSRDRFSGEAPAGSLPLPGAVQRHRKGSNKAESRGRIRAGSRIRILVSRKKQKTRSFGVAWRVNVGAGPITTTTGGDSASETKRRETPRQCAAQGIEDFSVDNKEEPRNKQQGEKKDDELPVPSEEFPVKTSGEIPASTQWARKPGGLCTIHSQKSTRANSKTPTQY